MINWPSYFSIGGPAGSKDIVGGGPEEKGTEGSSKGTGERGNGTEKKDFSRKLNKTVDQKKKEKRKHPTLMLIKKRMTKKRWTAD